MQQHGIEGRYNIGAPVQIVNVDGITRSKWTDTLDEHVKEGLL